jgi:hypothetical protein
MRPALEAARVALFRAALEARDDKLAVVVNASLDGLTGTETAATMAGLAGAHQRLGNLARARDYYKSARDWDPSGSHADWDKQILALTAELDRRAKNSLRRPVVSENLEQDRIVKLRLASGGVQ